MARSPKSPSGALGGHWGIGFCRGASSTSHRVPVPRNAPPPLASCLAHEAVSKLLQADLSEFRKKPRQEEDDDAEEEKAPVTCEFCPSWGPGA